MITAIKYFVTQAQGSQSSAFMAQQLKLGFPRKKHEKSKSIKPFLWHCNF
jgi:hypothetical protein